jgi:chaperonin GroES
VRAAGAAPAAGGLTPDAHASPRISGDDDMKVRPLGDKIIIKRAESKDRTESGIYLPETAKDKPKEGKVIAVGNGVLNKETGEYMPFTVKKGDNVLFTTYSGTEIKVDGDEYIIMTEDDILGIIE